MIIVYGNLKIHSLNINIKSELATYKFGHEFVIKPEKQTMSKDMFELLDSYELAKPFSFVKDNGSYIATFPIVNDDDETFINKVFEDTSLILELLKDCFYE